MCRAGSPNAGQARPGAGRSASAHRRSRYHIHRWTRACGVSSSRGWGTFAKVRCAAGVGAARAPGREGRPCRAPRVACRGPGGAASSGRPSSRPLREGRAGPPHRVRGGPVAGPGAEGRGITVNVVASSPTDTGTAATLPRPAARRSWRPFRCADRWSGSVFAGMTVPPSSRSPAAREGGAWPTPGARGVRGTCAGGCSPTPCSPPPADYEQPHALRALPVAVPVRPRVGRSFRAVWACGCLRCPPGPWWTAARPESTSPAPALLRASDR